MDAPPPIPPAGQSAFPTAALKCDLPDVTAELLNELDTDVLPALTNTAFTLDLRNAATLANGTSTSVTAGRLSVEISESSVDSHPCYQVMASLMLRAGGSVKVKTSVQVISQVSTQLDTLRESRVVTVGGKHRFTRNVWGVGITPPGSTRVSSALPGSARPQSAAVPGTSSATGSKPASASHSSKDAEGNKDPVDPLANNLDEYLNTIPEDTTPSNQPPSNPDSGTDAPAPTDAYLSSGSAPSSASARPMSSRVPRPASSSSHATRPGSSAPPKPRAHYLVQHQSVTLGGSPDDDGEDHVTSTSTHVVDHATCPGLLFSGSQLIFLLLVAFHVQSTGLSVPEVFVTHAYADVGDAGQPSLATLTLTSDPLRPQVLGGLARKLVGVRVDRGEPGPDAALHIVGHLSQWYFAPSVTPCDAGDRPSSAAEVFAGAAQGLELVAVARVAGADGVVTDPRGGGGSGGAGGAGHPADDADLGGAIEVQSMYYELKAEEETNLASLLHTRPELTAMLTDFMRAVLVKKPKDVYAFAREHFALPH